MLFDFATSIRSGHEPFYHIRSVSNDDFALFMLVIPSNTTLIPQKPPSSAPLQSPAPVAPRLPHAAPYSARMPSSSDAHALYPLPSPRVPHPASSAAVREKTLLSVRLEAATIPPCATAATRETSDRSGIWSPMPHVPRSHDHILPRPGAMLYQSDTRTTHRAAHGAIGPDTGNDVRTMPRPPTRAGDEALSVLPSVQRGPDSDKRLRYAPKRSRIARCLAGDLPLDR
jgi:hypothetical protein